MAKITRADMADAPQTPLEIVADRLGWHGVTDPAVVAEDVVGALRDAGFLPIEPVQKVTE